MQKRRRLVQKKNKLTHEDVEHLAQMFGITATATKPPAGADKASASSSTEAEPEKESDAKAASDE